MFVKHILKNSIFFIQLPLFFVNFSNRRWLFLKDLQGSLTWVTQRQHPSFSSSMDIATDQGLNVDITNSRFSGWAMPPTIRANLAVVPDHRDFVRPAAASHNGPISSVDQPQEQGMRPSHEHHGYVRAERPQHSLNNRSCWTLGCPVNGSGDGIESPQRVLFLAERLSLKWNQIHSIGAGLKNMGNTCFLNSALQCLTYTAPFTNYMLTQEHSRTCVCLPRDVILVMQWFYKITNGSGCVFLFPALCLCLPCQALSQGSAWCAPWKTTSFTYLPTRGMLSSPSVCSASSKVSEATVWKTLFCFFLNALFGCLLHQEPRHWNPSAYVFTFLIRRDCGALSVWETRGCPWVPALRLGCNAAVLLAWKHVSYAISRGSHSVKNLDQWLY